MRRQFAADRERSWRFLQVHARVVVDIRFRDRHPSQPWLFCQKRQPDQPILVQAAHLPQRVFVFIRGLESLQHQRVTRRILRKCEFRQLMLDDHLVIRRLIGNNVAKRHAIIEDPHLHAEFVPRAIGEVRAQRVVIVAHLLCLPHRNRVAVVDLPGLRRGLNHPRPQCAHTRQIQPQP